MNSLSAIAFFLLAATLYGAGGYAQNNQPPGQAEPLTQPAATSTNAPEQPATAGQIGGPPEESAPRPNELDLPEDDSVKVRINPLIVGNVVDRVAEPATIVVECPQAINAAVYLVPVDSPYGGHPVGKPRLLGQDNKPMDGLTVHWASRESDPYVKIFAVVHKKGQPFMPVRSHTIDLAMAGMRYRPKPKPTEDSPTSDAKDPDATTGGSDDAAAPGMPPNRGVDNPNDSNTAGGPTDNGGEGGPPEDMQAPQSSRPDNGPQPDQY